uniref:Uncharacterized protein n=1 Tax=Kalanchoe fedtschenkoi TaxID=63787 RepID=A0A7N0U2N3_KALFE
MSSFMRNMYSYGLEVAPDALITPHRISCLPGLATIQEESHASSCSRKHRFFVVLPLFLSAIFLLLVSKPTMV